MTMKEEINEDEKKVIDRVLCPGCPFLEAYKPILPPQMGRIREL